MSQQNVSYGQGSQATEQLPKHKHLTEQTFIQSALELAEILKNDPSSIDKKDYEAGKKLISIFHDNHYNNKIKDFKDLRKTSILFAIDDIASGALTLKNNTIGLKFISSKVVPFNKLTVKSNTDTNTIFSIQFKKAYADLEIRQEDLNMAIYYLIVYLSKLQ